MRARIQRVRAKYRKRMLIVGIIFFILGVALGILAYRWFAGSTPEIVVAPEITPTPEVTEVPTEPPTPAPEITEAPTEAPTETPTPVPMVTEAPTEAPTATPAPTEEPEAEQPEQTDAPEIFPEGEPDGAVEGEPEIFPEEETVEEPAEEPAEEPVEEPAEEPAEEPVEEPEDEPVEEPVEEPAATATPAAEAPAEVTPAENEAPAETAAPDEAAAPEVSAEPEETEAPVEEGPQVIAIVPYGESFTYATQILSDGTARVTATDEPYETISFTQTMKDFMRPTDFAAKYSTQYRLQGNEAGAGFELVLNGYTGTATIVPQNVVDISLRSESGDSTERGYQLMDAEIAGNYDVAVVSDTPKMLYKRYQYSATGEEMAYLVVTTYNDGVPQMILFEVESDEPEPTPEVVYPTLQRGIKSDEVAAMQARLIELGYLTGTADGNFGPMTEEAIRAAQEAFGMEPTGIADNAFQQRLFEGAEPTPAPEAEEAEAEEEPAADEPEPTEDPMAQNAVG